MNGLIAQLTCSFSYKTQNGYNGQNVNYWLIFPLF